ncbi:MAG: protein-glutamate O-methyltransferase CheR [Bacillota bacterium]|nr:protein-glutamate O-methyltransferase CheR [Bacillota bacterium]
MEGYEKFKSRILLKTGLDLNLYKERQMKRRIESLISRQNIAGYEEYYRHIDTNQDAFNEFINFLTINVSEFYRNVQQWEILVDTIFPELLKGKRTLKIWSAACSTGEEPYSLVMALSNLVPLRDIKIFACDFDEAAMARAKLGVYSPKSIQNVPKEFQTKYFDAVGTSFKIKDEIKRCVEFKKMDLLKDRYPTGYDLIVCRNVMIYFTEEAKDEMYRKFHASLSPGGYFFVGSTEQIIQPARFGFEASKTFFYRKKA